LGGQGEWLVPKPGNKSFPNLVSIQASLFIDGDAVGAGGGGLGTASCLPRTREKTSQGWAHAVLWTLEAHPRSFLWLFPSIVSPVPPTAAGHQAPWSQSHLILLPDHHRLLWPGL
jgi:hypothetical protein